MKREVEKKTEEMRVQAKNASGPLRRGKTNAGGVKNDCELEEERR